MGSLYERMLDLTQYNKTPFNKLCVLTSRLNMFKHSLVINGLKNIYLHSSCFLN